MKNITLKDILLTQDMGEPNANKICEQVLNNEFNPKIDLISAIIIETFESNGYSDYESMLIDLDYAISQLKKAIKAIEKA